MRYFLRLYWVPLQAVLAPNYVLYKDAKEGSAYTVPQGSEIDMYRKVRPIFRYADMKITDTLGGCSPDHCTKLQHSSRVCRDCTNHRPRVRAGDRGDAQSGEPGAVWHARKRGPDLQEAASASSSASDPGDAAPRGSGWRERRRGRDRGPPLRRFAVKGRAFKHCSLF